MTTLARLSECKFFLECVQKDTSGVSKPKPDHPANLDLDHRIVFVKEYLERMSDPVTGDGSEAERLHMREALELINKGYLDVALLSVQKAELARLHGI